MVTGSTGIPHDSNGGGPRKVTGRLLFEPGAIVATRGAAAVMVRLGLHPLALAIRHMSGDWGAIGEEDRLANEEALKDGARLMSVFKFGSDTLWIITEADRSVLTILLPDEY